MGDQKGGRHFRIVGQVSGRVNLSGRRGRYPMRCGWIGAFTVSGFACAFRHDDLRSCAVPHAAAHSAALSHVGDHTLVVELSTTHP